MKNLSWKNFKANFLAYLPALLIMGLGTALINIVVKIQKHLDQQLHNNVAGIEVLVGAKGSPIQLTMANIYHLDDPTGNIPFEKALQLSQNPMIAKAIPLAYGDNHKGYRILGTTLDYILHYKGKLAEGKYITKPLEIVAGSEVSKQLKINVGYTFYSQHGAHGGHKHTENQYVVIGVLEKSNTVLDNLLITSISSFWKTHNQQGLENQFDEQSFAQAKKSNQTNNQSTNSKQIECKTHTESKHKHINEHSTAEHEHAKEHQHTENEDIEEHEAKSQKEITALLLKFRGTAGFFLINQINADPELMAINPSQTVLKFMTVLGVGYSTIHAIAFGVIGVAIITLMLTLIQVFSKRKYELALLRTMGASKSRLLGSLLSEVAIISVFGFVFGLVIMFCTLEIVPLFTGNSIFKGFDWTSLGIDESIIFIICLVCGMISVCIPLYNVYRIDISKTLSNEA